MRKSIHLPLAVVALSFVALASLSAQQAYDLSGAPVTPELETRLEEPTHAFQNARNIHEPFVYWVPAQGLAEGATAPTMLVCPGGGYYVLAYQKEGIDIARRLSTQGFHVAVLMSRLPATEDVPYPKTVAVEDGRAALRMLRTEHARFRIDTGFIGVMGFSAGGHEAMLLSTLDDARERPRASVLVYPVITMRGPHAHGGSRDALLGPAPSAELVTKYSGEDRVDKATPPTYLVHSADDKGVSVMNSLLYAEALHEHDVPFAMQVLPKGGHGYGMYPMIENGDWMAGVIAWLKGLR